MPRQNKNTIKSLAFTYQQVLEKYNTNLILQNLYHNLEPVLEEQYFAISIFVPSKHTSEAWGFDRAYHSGQHSIVLVLAKIEI